MVMSMFVVPDEFLNRVADTPGLITVVVNDATRQSPSQYLAALYPVLKGRSRILFATGTHIHTGTTSRGTPVDIHPWLLEGAVLAVNTVEPHYFAGFTGGRKSFLPGSSSRRTIVGNHFLACLPGALPGKLKGNPVHEDMMEGAFFLAERTQVFMLNGVSGSDNLYCGDFDESFLQASGVAVKTCGVPVEKRFKSLLLTPGKSLEVSLYQAMKAVFLWESAVEDGGHLVLSADCPEGFGARQMERLLSLSSTSVAVPRCSEEYSPGDHAAIGLGRIRSRLRLSFRVGIDMSRFGFDDPPDSCEMTVENGGFTYPVGKQ